MTDDTDGPSLDASLHQLRYVQAAPFFSGIIHDLNNRLGAIVAYADLLSMGSNSPEEVDSMLDNIVASARQAQKVGDALGLIVRQDEGKMVNISIPKHVDLVAALCEFRMRSLGIAFDLSIDGDLNRTHTCNPHDFGRAITYLLRNAMENVESVEKRRVSCAVEIQSDAVEIRVQDNGPAMTAAQFEELRAPFATTKAVGEHAGLGLAGVDTIARAHGGSLVYDAECGFVLRLVEPAD